MTILQKGKRWTRRSSATCFREVIILLLMGRCTIRSAELILSYKKDLNAEQKVEDALDAATIFYAKSEVWIDSEKLYEVLYEMEV